VSSCNTLARRDLRHRDTVPITLEPHAEIPFTPDDLATWLLFYIESHGAEVVLHVDRRLTVNLNTIPGMDEITAARWAPIIVGLIPELRSQLQSRPRC
jgi:hypothetical protein